MTTHNAVPKYNHFLDLSDLTTEQAQSIIANAKRHAVLRAVVHEPKLHMALGKVRLCICHKLHNHITHLTMRVRASEVYEQILRGEVQKCDKIFETERCRHFEFARIRRNALPVPRVLHASARLRAVLASCPVIFMLAIVSANASRYRALRCSPLSRFNRHSLETVGTR